MCTLQLQRPRPSSGKWEEGSSKANKMRQNVSKGHRRLYKLHALQIVAMWLGVGAGWQAALAHLTNYYRVGIAALPFARLVVAA